MARNSSTFLAGMVIVGFLCITLHFMSEAFLPVPGMQESRTNFLGAAAGASAATAALSVAGQPAFAEEGFLDFGRIPLGGGFAINLDIPETGIVNIAVLIGGLLYLLGPLLTESMATREKEIQQDIDDAIAKYDEAITRLEEAQKAQAQADEVIAEIEGSIEKDKASFAKSINEAAEATIAAEKASTTASLADIAKNADAAVGSFIKREAIARGKKELSNISKETAKKFTLQALEAL